MLETGLRRAWHLARRRAPRSWVDAVARSALPRATVPALLTARPARFGICELSGGRRLRRHRLRGTPWEFGVHHGGPDASVLAEVFRKRYYEVPPAMVERLAALGRPPRIGDLGAHVGFFGLWVLQRHPGADVLSFEPDPVNYSALSLTIAANADRASGWRAVAACAATADGERMFRAGDSSSSRVVEGDGDGIVVPARDVFPSLEGVDMLKIDIEGGEWELLGDPRFALLRPAVLFLEYHPHLCPEPDPRARATARLAELGYDVEEVFATAGGTGLLRATR